MRLKDRLVGPDLFKPGLYLETSFIHKRAGSLLAIDSAFQFQPAQRITNGRTTDAQFRCQFHFRGDAPFGKLFVQNPFFDLRFS